MPRILDLYCGMGGLSLGFVLALEDAEVLGLDIDRHAVDTFNHNLRRFNSRAVVQDVLKWEPKGEFDVIVGGVPCQPYSLANTKKRGKEHPLYPTLPRFFDIVLALRPKVFLMENVKGLITRRHKPLLDEQLRRVEPFYNIRWQVLNAAYYGVPQRRERLFVLGIRRDLGVTPSFPPQSHAEEKQKTLAGKLFKWVSVREAIGDLLVVPPLLASANIPEHSLPAYERERMHKRVLDGEYIKKHPPLELDMPSRAVPGHIAKSPKDLLLPVSEHVMTAGGGWDNPRSEWGSRVMPSDKPSYTITEKHRSGQLVQIPPTTEEAISRSSPVLVGDGRIYATGRREHGSDKEKGCLRRLTVRECLRLQSFPDWWGFPSHISISRKYKLTGETVPPILAYRIAVHVGRLMGWRTREPPREEDWQLPYFKRAFQDYFSS